MWRTPIFDRTLDDATYARQHPEAVEDLKGALNYSDLNRIEENFKHVAQRLLERGVYIELVSRNFLETWWNSQESETDPDTDFNTVLLLHGEDFTDSSAYGHTINKTGCTISDDGKFDKAINFTGTNKLETTEQIIDLNGTFTIDFWCKHRSIKNYATYVGGTENNTFKINVVNTKLTFELHAQGTSVSTDFSPQVGEWFHVALTGNNKSFTFFVNGKKIKTFSVSVQIPNSILRIGINYGQNITLDGLLDEFRISNIVRWTSDFEVPTAPYDIGTKVDSNTKLLLHAEDFTDASVFKHEIVNSGATIVEGKFGNGFNFTNLQKVETTSSLVDTSGKFTVEFWCNQRQLKQNCTYIGGVDNNSFKIQLIDGKIGFDVHGLNVKQKTDFQPTLNEWFHVALTGNNKTFSFFINGKKVKTFSVTQTIVNGNMRIGLNYVQNDVGSVEGIIDELRISDIVRYTEDFELQNKPFDIYILDTEERPFEESATFTDWQMRNILWLREINRIRKNFNTLNSVYPKSTNIPNSKESNYINYEEVNNWEKAAYEANEAVDRMDKLKRYCGTFNCGGDPL